MSDIEQAETERSGSISCQERIADIYGDHREYQGEKACAFGRWFIRTTKDRRLKAAVQ